jgi:hypothetical protein
MGEVRRRSRQGVKNDPVWACSAGFFLPVGQQRIALLMMRIATLSGQFSL